MCRRNKVKRFILPKNAKSNVVNGHVFQNGELIVSDEDGKRMAKVLCRFYGVQMEDVEVQVAGESETDPDASLSASNTKGGQSTSDSEEEDE